MDLGKKPEPREQWIQLLPTRVGPTAINIVEGRQEELQRS